MLLNQTIELEFARIEIDKLQLENEQLGILNEELVKQLSERNKQLNEMILQNKNLNTTICHIFENCKMICDSVDHFHQQHIELKNSLLFTPKEILFQKTSRQLNEIFNIFKHKSESPVFVSFLKSSGNPKLNSKTTMENTPTTVKTPLILDFSPIASHNSSTASLNFMNNQIDRAKNLGIHFIGYQESGLVKKK